MEKVKCHWCGEELNIKNAEEKGNARGYGYYITCPNCNEEKVLYEIDRTHNESKTSKY